MVPAELDRIFDAFAQGDHAGGGAHRFGGLGLGLAISRRIVELHNGQITAVSAGRNQGCVFSIELPGIRSGSPGSTNSVSPLALPAPLRATPVAPEVPGSQLVILLIEDHAPTRLALAALLKRRHYHVLTAGTAAEARAVAEKDRIDIVISDIGLPDGSGFDLMAEFKVQYGLKGIALTGYGMENDLLRSREAGFVTHLTKPVRMQSLDHALAALIVQVPGK